MTDDEKRRVAIHEAGHALVAMSVPRADPVHRVTILPRSSGALGATLQLPADDRYLATRDELLDRMCVLLAGRAAEELVLGDLSSGAADDLQRATELARQMVCRFGMSARLGDQTLERGTYRFLDGALSGEPSADRSEATARIVDEEIRAFLLRERARAAEIVAARRQTLDAISARLIAEETLERDALLALVGAGPASWTPTERQSSAA
jgi:cell division protease FtsH